MKHEIINGRKVTIVDWAQVKRAFTEQTGIPESAIVETFEAFPASYSFTIQTENKTFIGWLTYGGRAKKNSIKEEV